MAQPMEGYLTKKGSFMPTWKSRFFEISCYGDIQYYKNETKLEKKGDYVIDADTTVEALDGYDSSHTSVFVIKNHVRDLYMSATDDTQRSRWINAIKVEIIKKRKANPFAGKSSGAGTTDEGSLLDSLNPFNSGKGSPDNSSATVSATATSSSSSSPPPPSGPSTGKKETTVVLEGFLIKRGAIVQSWNARWFVLSCEANFGTDSDDTELPEYRLSYYKDSAKGKLKGSFVIDKTTSIQSSLDIGEYSNVFIISRQAGDSQDRTIYVSAMNAKTETQWIDTLNVVIRKLIVLSMKAQGIHDEAVQKKLIINNARSHSLEAAERIRTRRIQAHMAAKQRGTRRFSRRDESGKSEAHALASKKQMEQNNEASEDEEEEEEEDEESVGVSGGTGAGIGGGGNAAGNHHASSSSASETGAGNSPGLPRGWQEVKTEDGTVYYYHVLARVSRWDKPTPEVAAAVEERLRENEAKAVEATQRRKAEMELRRQQEKEKSEQAGVAGGQVSKQIEQWKYVGSTRQVKALQDLLLDLPLIVPTLIPDVDAIGIRQPLDASNPLTSEEIRKVYLKVVRCIHPDKLGGDLELTVKMTAEEVFIQLTEQYNRFKKQAE